MDDFVPVSVSLFDMERVYGSISPVDSEADLTLQLFPNNHSLKQSYKWITIRIMRLLPAE